MEEFQIRDNRQKEWFWLDNEYLNGYAKFLGTSCTVVYLSLCRHSDNNTQSCFPSMELIAEENGIHKSTVLRAIKTLEEWGIINVIRRKKEDGKQENNIYYLTKKSCWKEKPSSTKILGSRVAINKDPSSIECKSRVAQSDCNKTHINNTQLTRLNTSKSEICETNINPLLDIFYKKINPTLNFGNKTERKALQEMLDKFGEEKLKAMIEYAISIQSEQYAPVITTPCELKRKLGQLISYKAKNNKNNQIVEI
jgi:hypothetical protein